ncbi:MAG: glycosyltransferase family 39 protein [Flavobacteriia bacterium]|nr:glycosyltransferase family 39 protein [Flavobacteriia bacterium]
MSKKQFYNPFYITCIAIYIFLIGRFLLADTMFVDGLIYGAIAKNLANGHGTFWNLHFTTTIYPEFHEHPPLAMGLQSLFFKLLGTNRFVEKIYSLLTFIIVGITIVKIWKLIHPTNHNSWSPILFWITIPVIFWATGNNLLENTLVVFTTFSLYFYLKSQLKVNHYFLFLAGIMLFFAFLSKGFVAFFPLSMPFFYWLLIRNTSSLKMILHTLILIVFSLLPLILLFLFSENASKSLINYFEIQVVNSLKNIATVDSRFFILKRMLSELILPITIGLIFYFSYFKKGTNLKIEKNQKLYAFFFITIGLSAVIPITISMKQSGFYILSAYPLFAIALGLIFQNQTSLLTNLIYSNTKLYKRFSFLSMILLIGSISFTIACSSKYGKDELKVKDMRKIIQVIPPNTFVSICPLMNEDWALHAYYKRYKSINLDHRLNKKHKYLIINPEECLDFIIDNSYQLVKIKTLKYKLYKRN